MATAQCRTCDRVADAGAYCNSCAADIMANALNPHFRRQRKKRPPGQGTLPRRPGPAAVNTSNQQRLFG